MRGITDSDFKINVFLKYSLTNLTKFESVHYLGIIKYHLKHLVLLFLFEVEMASNKAVRRIKMTKRPKSPVYIVYRYPSLVEFITLNWSRRAILSPHSRLQNSEQ